MISLLDILMVILALLSFLIIFLTTIKKPDRGHKIFDMHINRVDSTDKFIFGLITIYIILCATIYMLQ